MIRHTPRKQCPEISYLELRVVLSLAGAQVIGYYTLFAGAISCDAAPKSMRRNTPIHCPCCYSAGWPSTGAITIRVSATPSYQTP